MHKYKNIAICNVKEQVEIQEQIDSFQAEIRKLGNQLNITLKEFKEIEKQLL